MIKRFKWREVLRLYQGHQELLINKNMKHTFKRSDARTTVADNKKGK